MYRLSERRRAIQQALDDYLGGRIRDEDPVLGAHELEVARLHRAVPLLRDSTTTIFLRLDGSLLGWDNATPGPPDEVRRIDPLHVPFTFLLAAAARTHRALTPLLPDGLPRHATARLATALAFSRRLSSSASDATRSDG